MLNTSSNEFLAVLLKTVEALAEEVKELKSATTPAVIKGIQGIADFLGVSKSVAQKMKNEGVIPCIQYDRVVLFKPDVILRALELQTPRYNR